LAILREEGTVREDVDDRLHILIRHLRVLASIGRVHLDVVDEENQELQRELQALITDFQ
jgi:hypothetical protein